MSSDIDFSSNLLFRTMNDQIQRLGVAAPSLPEPQPMNDGNEQLLNQVAEVIGVIGDVVDRHQSIINLIKEFARVLDIEMFKRLANKVFHDGITWGKIATLICIVGKAIVMKIGNSVPDFVFWTLNYFKDNLQNWICNNGGWINSISPLTRFALELNYDSSMILPSSALLFISGVLLGGIIVWSLSRRT